MRKYWMVLGLAAALVMACGEKEPAPPPPPAPAAPETTEQDVPPAPVDTVKTEEPAKIAAGTMVRASDKVDPGRMPPGPYTIQVAAWETRSDAQKLADFYRGKGYDSRVEEADVKGGRWYRVRISKFDNFSQAQETALKIQQQYKSEIWLVKL